MNLSFSKGNNGKQSSGKKICARMYSEEYAVKDLLADIHLLATREEDVRTLRGEASIFFAF